MRLFEDIQRVAEVGKTIKVSVPASFSMLLDNKTDVPVTIYHYQSSKVGFPLLAGETLEIEKVLETSDFWVRIEETEMKENQGLYIIARPFMESDNPEQNNTVIFNQQKK